MLCPLKANSTTQGDQHTPGTLQLIMADRQTGHWKTREEVQWCLQVRTGCSHACHEMLSLTTRFCQSQTKSNNLTPLKKTFQLTYEKVIKISVTKNDVVLTQIQ